MRDLKKLGSSSLRAVLIALTTSMLLANPVIAEEPPQVLIKNVNIFDGKNNGLQTNMHVLVEGEQIASISRSAPSVDSSVHIVEGDGRTLMPGLIDGHAHVMINQNFGTIETLSLIHI